jgi:hypothetical protein
VWNPGEYVEGYTNPLMTLLMALPTLLFDKVYAVLATTVFCRRSRCSGSRPN